MHGAELHERPVAAPVHHGGSRLEAMNAHRIEHELEHQVGAFLEHPRAPEGRSDREAPLGGAESGLGLTDLEDPDGSVEPVQRDGEAGQL